MGERGEVGEAEPRVQAGERGAGHEPDDEQGGQEVAELEGGGGEALGEVAAVEGVAPDLPQVGAEEGAAVVENLSPRVVDDALALA